MLRCYRKPKLLAERVRLEILLALEKGETNVGALAVALDQRDEAMSKHLQLLRLAGLVEGRRVGKQTFYTLTDAGRATASTVGIVAGTVGG